MKRKEHNLVDFKCKRIETNGDNWVYKGRKIIGWASINFDGYWEHIETFLYDNGKGGYDVMVQACLPDGYCWDWKCNMDEDRIALYKKILLDNSEWTFGDKAKKMYLDAFTLRQDSSKTNYKTEIENLR